MELCTIQIYKFKFLTINNKKSLKHVQVTTVHSLPSTGQWLIIPKVLFSGEYLYRDLEGVRWGGGGDVWSKAAGVGGGGGYRVSVYVHNFTECTICTGVL